MGLTEWQTKSSPYLLTQRIGHILTVNNERAEMKSPNYILTERKYSFPSVWVKLFVG